MNSWITKDSHTVIALDYDIIRMRKTKKRDNMKHIFLSLLIIIISLSLTACKEDPNLIKRIDLSFNEESLELTTEDDHIEIVTSDLGDVIRVEIHVDAPFYFSKKTALYVNNSLVSHDLLTIEKQGLIYTMPHPNPRNPLDYVSVDVTFDPNGGSWGSEIIEVLEPAHELTITALNDLSGATFSLFDHTQIQLRWYYKMFIKYSEVFEAYEVVYSDPSTASVSNLELPDYDYVIGVHLHTVDIVARDLIISLVEEDKRPMLITFDQSLDTYTSGNLGVSILTQEQVLGNLEKTYKEIETLPIPTLTDFTFLGWSDGTSIHHIFPRYQVKDHVNSITYTAVWGSKNLDELNTYLSSLIPEQTLNNLILPKSYSGFELTWESSEPDVISSEGLFKRSYQNVIVTLTVTATLEDSSDILTFETSVKGYKSLTGPIASSYIYRNFEGVTDEFFEVLDIINGAFITAESDGSLVGTAFLSSMQKYILPKAKLHGNWVLPSIAPDSAWSSIASSSVKTNILADNIVNLINTYGFDGVDIDWETPRPGEEAMYTELMRVVYTKVKANNSNHLVTTAIAGGMWQPPRYNLSVSKNYVDYINMMTYGMVSGGAQYQNALYPASSYHNTMFNAGRTLTSCSIDESVKMYKSNYQVDYDQIIVGVAFYGMRQNRTYNESTQSWSSWVGSGSVYYTDIASNYLNNSNFIKAYDDRAGVPYLLKTDGTEFISYDNPKSIIEKSEYVIENGLAGIMYWENGLDSTGALLGALRTGLMK